MTASKNNRSNAFCSCFWLTAACCIPTNGYV